MCYPVATGDCDACERRLVLIPAAFTALRGHGDGQFCATCRDTLPGEEPEE